MTVYFGDDSFLKLRRERGHLFAQILTVYAGGSVEGEKINFILDTGAFMTVISRDTAEQFGYDTLPKILSRIKGYSGEAVADFTRIPSLRILDTLLTDVPVLIPHSMELRQNIVGLNVLEYFNYYVDNENDRLYLSLNPDPRPYDKLFACGGVFAIHPDE